MKSGLSGSFEFSYDLFFTLVEKSRHLITNAQQFATIYTCKSVLELEPHFSNETKL